MPFRIEIFRNLLCLKKLIIFEQIFWKILRAYVSIRSNSTRKMLKSAIFLSKWSFERCQIIKTRRHKGTKTVRQTLRVSLCLIFLFTSLPCFAFPFGKDADLAYFKMEPEECPSPPCSGNIGVALSRALIRFHHNVVTPIDGPRSHYRPSSSQYTLDAIEKYGFIRGWVLGCDRLLRENDDPWIYPTMIDEHGDRYKSDPVR